MEARGRAGGAHAGREGAAARLRARAARIDWADVRASLDAAGHARIPRLLPAAECRRLAALFDDDSRFRSRVDMAGHRFGEGEYRYFSRPLPPVVSALREALYPPLARIANRWLERVGAAPELPASLARYLAVCRAHEQTRPTPLLLRYGPGGFNNLHRDLYGAVAFPLQVTILLSAPERDFTGGEFLLVEQRPRQQARGEAIALRRGEAIVFPTRERPVQGARGTSRASVRHGVSRIHSGRRFALGVIFHDAR